MKTDGKGHVFGSVSKDQIMKALRDRGIIGAERVEIALDHPLKTLGPALVRVDLKRGVEAKLQVILREQS
jgi:ribosomal protein L9